MYLWHQNNAGLEIFRHQIDQRPSKVSSCKQLFERRPPELSTYNFLL